MKGELTSIIEVFGGIMDRIEALEGELNNVREQLDDRLIDRSYVKRLTGWSSTTMWKYDNEYNIFEGKKQIPFSKFNAIFQEIFGTRGARQRSTQ